MSVVVAFVSVTRAVPRAPSYAPVPPVIANGMFLALPVTLTIPTAVNVPFDSVSWTVHRPCVPTTVQMPRLRPVSSPLTVEPKPKRSPWRGR